MIKAIWLAGVLSLPAVSAAQDVNALPGLNIEIGSTALVSFDAAGKPVVAADDALPLTPGELDILAQVQGRGDEAMGKNSIQAGTSLAIRPVPKDNVRFSFVKLGDGQQSLLIIYNGFDQSFAYKARIGVGAQSETTDVCQALPERVAIEHWPYKIDWIEIRDIHEVPWKEGDKPVCE